MKKIKYTILITVYNKEKYLKKCLDSIFNQTFKEFEVIACDDGSTDRGYDILKKYDIKLYKRKNHGVSDTRNFLISKVKTKYFLFVDADDYIDKNLLATINKYDDYDILSFNGKEVSENNKVKKLLNKGSFIGNGLEVIKKLISKHVYFDVPWGYVYNTEYIIKNNFLYPSKRVHEDFYLTPLIIINAKKIIGIEDYLYNYVQSKNSIVRNKQMIEIRKKDMLNNYFSLCKKVDEKKDIDDNTKKYLYSFFLRTILCFTNELKLIDRFKYLKNINKKNNKYFYLSVFDGRVKKFLMNISLNIYIIFGIPYYKLKNILIK